MSIRIHAKDLPDEGITILLPSDPSFESRFTEQVRGESATVKDSIRPFSIFLENKSQHTVVGYMIQWCFVGDDGKNNCFRRAFTASRALMEGEDLSEEVEARSGKIRPNADLFVSLVSPEGGGPFRVRITQDEAEKVKQGGTLDNNEILRRSSLQLAQYTDLTVSIDGAFFDDGTFVGDDESGFFAQVKAEVDARRDLLNELMAESKKGDEAKEQLIKHIEIIAAARVPALTSKSLPQDYYNFYRSRNAKEFLSSRKYLGEEKAIASAIEPTKKAWRVLVKKHQ